MCAPPPETQQMERHLRPKETFSQLTTSSILQAQRKALFPTDPLAWLPSLTRALLSFFLGLTGTCKSVPLLPLAQLLQSIRLFLVPAVTGCPTISNIH